MTNYVGSFVWVLCVSASAHGSTLPLVTDGQSGAAIVLGDQAGEFEQLAARELQGYIKALTGVRVEITKSSQLPSQPPDRTLLLLGGPNQHEAVRELATAGLVDFAGLNAEGFVLKTVRWNQHSTVVVAGNDEAGTLYATYELLERLGITFRLTGDIVPQPTTNLSLAELDLRMEPACSRRGFLLGMCFDNVAAFSFQDYEKLLDQMARMKCNYLQFWWFPYAPWLNYAYRGESKRMGDVSQKDSGYHSWTFGGFGSRTVNDVSIGRRHFKAHQRIAPLEMQAVETPEEAFAVSQDLLQRIIDHAHRRNIKVWLVVETASLPPNLARHGEMVDAKPFIPVFGTFLHPQDPVNREIQVNRLKALQETYPDADGYFLNFSELYPDLVTPRHRDFYIDQRPKFHALRRLYFPWAGHLANLYGVNEEQMVNSNVGYFDLFQYLLKKRDEVIPRVKIGLMTVGRGYTLPLFDKMLPKDVPFTTLESSGVWTPSGVPMDYFGGMGERERTIQPRVDDDFDMMGMQFSTRQYAFTDRIFRDGVKHGLSGFAGQVERPRGTEFNSNFLADAAWEPQLSPEEFYREYSVRMFGEEAAAEMQQAFAILEDHQIHLGYYSYGTPTYGTMGCCSGLTEVHRARRYSQQANPFGGPKSDDWDEFIVSSAGFILRYEASIALLNRALDHMRAATANVAPRSEYELGYLINRTEAYRDLMKAIITSRRAYLSFEKAFDRKKSLSQEAFVARLDKSMQLFQAASEQVREATEKYAEIIDHTSDLVVLYHLNARAVLGFDLVQKWMQNVVNYHKGESYLEPVPFERLYSPGVFDVKIDEERD